MGRKLLSKWLASVAIACAATSLTGPVHAKDLTFGYLPNSMEYPYDVATVTGFQDEAKKAGVKTIVLDPRSSVEKQGNQLDDLLAQGVDAIGIMPQDSVVAEGWVDKIAERHIPIVAIAVPVGDPAKHPADYVYPKLTALVTTDDVEGGAVSGRLAAQMLPKDRVAKIAIVEGMPGFAVVPQREQGFEGALKKAGVKFEIVASQPSDWTPEKGESICQNVLTAHPDVDLFFSHADDMALGCAKAIKAAGSKAKLIATSGGSKLGNNAIGAGEFDGSVCARPELLGRLMFKALSEAVKNPNGPKAQYITYDMPTITKDTLKDCPPEW
jgi:ribose transport system substrate-binding protein